MNDPIASTCANMVPRAEPTTRMAPQQGMFGPSAHNAWSLDTDGLSLVREPIEPRRLRFEAMPQSIELDVGRSAVVVVDMQNDFCHTQGLMGQKGIDVQPMRQPISTIARLLPAWRDVGGAVIWLNWGVRPDRRNLSPTIHFKSKHGPNCAAYGTADGVGYAEHSAEDRGRSLVAGEWGAQVVDELTVASTDITVFKHRLSGFWDNEFDSILRQQGITTLLFAGVNTDRCVFSTLQDAGFLGYDCVLLADACSTPSPAYVSQAIHFIVQQLHGFVATAEAVQVSLSSMSSPHSMPPLSQLPDSPSKDRSHEITSKTKH